MFNFRKITSVLTSAIMVSSTVALAAAANYPAPFVQNGKADVAIVYGGSDAQQTDMVAASDIRTSLQSTLAQQASGTSSTSSAVEGGDYVKLERSSDKFNLGNNMSGVFGSTVNDEDLEVLLADGTYLNDENTEYDYEQKLTLQALSLTYFADSDYQDKKPSVGFHLGSSDVVLNYTLDFSTDAESDVSSGDLADFETTDLEILGKNYYILDAKNGTDASYFGKFTLLDSANTAIVSEGDTQTVTVGDKTYEVKISYIGDTSAKLDVNGQVTNTLNEGETYKLSDGTYVGIKDILYNSKDTGISKVEFSIGSGKLEIEAGQEMEMNDETVDGVRGWFVRGSASSSKQKLDKVIIEWSTEDEEFIAPDMALEMPGFKAAKMSMGSFIVPETETITVDYDGDDSIELTAPIKDGTASFNILGANASGDFNVIGKDSDERLATSSSSTLVYNQTSASNDYHKYFVATYATTDDAESYLLSMTINEKDNKNRTTIKNVVTGDNVCEDKAASDTCILGDVSFTISSVSKTSTSKVATLTAGSNVNFNTLYTKGGLKVFLPYEANSSTAKGAIDFDGLSTTAGFDHTKYFLYFQEENKDEDKASGKYFNVTLDANSDGDVHVTDVDTGSTDHEVPGTSDDTTSRVSSDLATEVKRLVSSDKGKSEIMYSGKESYAEVFLTAPSASVVGDGSSLGTLIVTDSEADKMTGKNLIVVGGGCINSVAASLLGSSSPLCGSDFTTKTGVNANEFLIQTFSRDGGKVATLVAGYSSGDTTNAATALRTQTIDTTVGKKYKGTTATSVEPVLA